jgi:hypothetical protein
MDSSRGAPSGGGGKGNSTGSLGDITLVEIAGTKYKLFMKLKTQLKNNLQDESFKPN